MLRTRAVEVSLWEAVLPDDVLRLPDELARVDALLDDPVFFVPFVPFFDPRGGRPSTPMEVYLRLMFLKFRYRLGYESLCREVGDSITWRRFCRIPIDGRMPHPTTLMKLTTRCGTAAVDGCNEALLAKAAEAKLLRTTRLRADTTVVPADVAYPTDSGLLAKAVRRIAAAGRRVQAAGGATRTKVRDRSRSAGRRAREIGAKLRLRAAQTRDEAQAVVRRITGELAGLAERAATDAEQLLDNARRALRRAQAKAAELAATGVHDAVFGRRRGRLRRAVNDLTNLLEATRRIAAQTRQRLSGITPDGATRRVSLHDGDARPIAKGRLGKPVEFGYKAQVSDSTPTTTMASCSTTPSSGATPPTLHNWPPRSAGSFAALGGARARSPPTAAMARPRLTRSCASSVCAPWSSHARAGPARPAKPTNDAARSAEPSSGAPAAKPGSAPSNEATGGIVHAWTTLKEPGSGPGTGSWPTTWSRSPPSRPDRQSSGDQPAPPAIPDPPDPASSAFFRSK
jgi:transposase, IS5 family